MRIRRIAIWISCSAVALALTVGHLKAQAEPAQPASIELSEGSGSGMGSNAAPNCANLIAQAGGAVVGLISQSAQLYQVCNANGWASTQCLAQTAVVLQNAVWVWWTMSQLYCQCSSEPNEAYCGGIGALPKPPNPGGGAPGMPPPGPQPPPPAPKPVNEDTAPTQPEFN